MARVPYSPVPDVAPNLQPTRPIFVNTPIAAFGGDTAQALGLMGRTLDTAGQELFTRAQAMQQVSNEATARAAAVNFSNDAGQLYANFRTKQGADAGPGAYADYQQQLGALRMKYRDGLNPMAGSLYDAQSYSVLERTNLYAAAHSAEQLDQYNKVTAVAGADAAANLAMLKPGDESAFQAALVKSDAAMDLKYHGKSPEVIAEQKALGRSKVAGDRIIAMADMPGQAPRAKALFDKALEDQVLQGADIPRIRDYVQKEMTRHTSVEIAHNVMSTVGPPKGATLLGDLIQFESGGRNIPNTTQGTSSGQAQGYMQITTGTWREFAPQAGVDLAKYPNAMSAPYGVQYAVAQNIPLNRWDPKTLHYLETRGWSFNVNKTLGENVLASNGQAPSAADRVAAARAKAESIDPDNPELADRAAMHTEQLISEQDRIQRQNALDVQNQTDEAIMGQWGKGPLTTQALMQDPGFAKMYQAADAKTQMAIDARILRASKQDNDPSDERDANLNRLMGQAYVDPEGFKKVDLFNENLTQEQRGVLFQEQKSLIKGKPLVDPAIKAALADPDVAAQMSSAGLTDKTSDDYKKFVGALTNEIRDVRAMGKGVTQEDYAAITSRLLQSSSGKFWQFFGPGYSGATAPYTVPLENIPAAFQDKLKQSLAAKLGRDPTESEIEHLWALNLWNETNMKAKINAR